MIRRWSYGLWVALMVASAFGLYMVKYRVQAVKVEVAEVSQQLEQERESLRVVEAEWAYLTRPERLQRLSARYLQLQPVQAKQVEAGDAPLSPATRKGIIIPVSAPAAPPAEGE